MTVSTFSTETTAAQMIKQTSNGAIVSPPPMLVLYRQGRIQIIGVSQVAL
jgi:hypothetical protein